MKIGASTREQMLGVLMIVAAVAYLIPFVPRGWISHDEGMLGQSAARVLHGDIPHVDYEDMYTGGLSWLHAAVFKGVGVDLINLRWALFIGASLAVWLIYAITRRYLRPSGAGLATWLALLWSFPNYFAGLPSWWLLICALLCLWTMTRYIETQHVRYVLAAGLAAGAAIAIKQTGVYLFLAVVWSLLYAEWRPRPTMWMTTVERVTRWALAGAAVMFAVAILWSRMFGAEGLYLLAPVVACAMALVVCAQRSSAPTSTPSPVVLVSLAAVGAALPLACLAVPYVTHHRLWELAYGTVLLPRKRLALASLSMPEAVTTVCTSLPLLGLALFGFRTRKAQPGIVLTAATWAAGIILPILALWNTGIYQAVWQFARTAAALVPIVIAWQLTSGLVQDARKRHVLFTAAATLAWMSLNQFPVALPTYFCYAAPLAVIAVIAAVDAQPTVRLKSLLPWAMLLLLFALLSTNRGYVDGLGFSHRPWRFDVPLDLPKAHLNVGAPDRAMYQGLVSSIARHLRGDQLIAGPDCPEVYFLVGLPNPSGKLYDFFSSDAGDDVGRWLKAEVVVLNHRPSFSAPPSQTVVTAVRSEFSNGERFGQFEIRWR